MAEPEKLDATFYAFKKRGERFVLTRAAAAYLALYALIACAYLVVSWGSFSALMGWYFGMVGSLGQGGGFTPPPPEALAMVPGGIAVGLVCLVLFAAFEAACLRWLVRGEKGGGLFGLTLGADTWRVLLTYLVWLLLFIAFSIAVALFYVAVSAFSSLGGAATWVAMLLGALAPLGFVALLLWGAVRLAPAAATSVARRRFAFFGALSVTRTHYWPLLGAFIILYVGYFVAATIVGQIAQIPMQQAMAPMLREMMSGNVGAMATQMQEVMAQPSYMAFVVVYSVVSAIIATVFYIATFGVNARAMQAAGEAAAA
jgi:hypothetical protein